MKPLKTAFLLCSFILFLSCKGEKEGENATPNFSIEAKEADWNRNEVDKLVKNAYKWVEKTDGSKFFRPFVKDSMIVGFDPISQNLYMKQMQESGYFAAELRNTIGKIFSRQNELLRSGKAVWHDGELGPFDTGVNQWCNCQDTPTDDYDKMNVVIEKMTSDTADLYWNWKGFGDDWEKEHYHINVVKEDGKWKIARMEGWDYETNVKLSN